MKAKGGRIKRQLDDLSSFVQAGGEFHLSNLGQLELLRATVERGIPLRIRVRGFSMAPFIRDDDVLTITPMNGRVPSVGEVVAFTLPDPGRLVIHRIIAARDGAWLVRGDNCPKPDGIVGCKNILGRVTRVERQGREVRLGLGGESRIIAALNRQNLLLTLKAWFHLPRRVAASVLRRAQAVPLYRALGKRFAPSIEIAEASADNMETVHQHFNPCKPYCAEPPDPSVTNWVAKRGARIIGFVQLVRQPEAHFPWVRHWLLSLEVWGRYRGLGIGEALMRRGLEQAQAEGARKVFGVTYTDNYRSLALCCKLGFEQITLPEVESVMVAEQQQFGRRRIVMRKRLTINP